MLALVLVTLLAVGIGGWFVLQSRSDAAAEAAPSGSRWAPIEAGDPGPNERVYCGGDPDQAPAGVSTKYYVTYTPEWRYASDVGDSVTEPGFDDERPVMLRGVYVVDGYVSDGDPYYHYLELAMLMTTGDGTTVLVRRSGVEDVRDEDVTRTDGVATGLAGWQTLPFVPANPLNYQDLSGGWRQRVMARDHAVCLPLDPDRGLYVSAGVARNDSYFEVKVNRNLGERYHWQNKAEVIADLEYVRPVEGAEQYQILPIVRDDTVAMLVVDAPGGGGVHLGTPSGLTAVAETDVVREDGEVVGVAGYTTLTLGNLVENADYDYNDQWVALAVPVGDRAEGRILRPFSLTTALEAIRGLVYDPDTDTLHNTKTGEVYRADNEQGFFISETTGGILRHGEDGLGSPVGWRPGT